MRRLLRKIRRRASGAARAYRATVARGGSVFSGIRNSIRYAASGSGRGG